LAVSLSIVSSLLYQPLPYFDGERLYSIWRPSRTHGRSLVSPGQIKAVADALGDRGDAAALRPGFVTTEYDLDFKVLGQSPRRLAVTGVSWNYFEVVGVRPLLGRSFLPQDAVDTPRSVVLSHALWLSAFGGTPDIVGKMIQLRSLKGEASYEVIGVMPSGFSSLYSVPSGRRIDRLFVEDLWVPISLDPRLWANQKRFWGIGIVRLGSRISLAEAQAQIGGVARFDASGRPGDSDSSLQLVRLREELIGAAGPLAISTAIVAALLWLQGLLGFGTSMTVRLRAKAKDFHILRALGSTEARIRFEVWLEIVVLGMAATAVGYVCARSVAHVLMLSLSEANPDILKIADTPLLAVGCLVFGSGTLAFGGFCAEAELRRQRNTPAIWSSRVAFGDRAVLVQICAGTALLIITAAVGQGAIRAVRTEMGFRSDRGVLATVDLLPAETAPAVRLAAQQALIDEIERTPGVRAGLTNSFPLVGVSYASEFIDAETGMTAGVAQEVAISEGFLELLEVPLRAGRFFTPKDMLPPSDVAIVSETWVQRYSSGGSPIGKQVMFAGPVWRRIIGVIADVRDARVSESPEPTIYVPLSGDARGRRTMVAAGNHASDEIRAVESAIRRLLPSSSVDGPTSVNAIVAAQTQAKTFYASALLVMTATGWLATLSGVYVLIRELSASRRRELAIRSALGATPQRVVWLLCGRVVLMAALGGAGGAGVAIVLTEILGALLLEVSDPPQYLVLAGWLAVVMATASTAYLAARREAISSPAQGLRFVA
jgi:putative ABC transport system permease protein